MSDARETRRRKFFDVLKLACEIATKRAAGNVVLVSRPIDGGLAINCRTNSGCAIELRFYVRLNSVFLVHKSGEEIIVGSLDDDEVKGQIAEAIVSTLPS